MNLVLLGYGKMGRAIEQIAINRGHKIVLRIDADNQEDLTPENIKTADAAIDFSTPASVINNINLCFEAGIPLIVGTTGWYNQLSSVKLKCEESNNSLLYASNFSLGVNVFFHINKVLASIMNRYSQYEVQVEEIHHTQKLDSPSGTAITIADDIVNRLDRKSGWINERIEDEGQIIIKPEQLLIESHRIEEVPGTHTVIYSSEIDEIELKHTANNRTGFAIGAVLAAEWLQDRKGFYNINEMFNFSV
ncbi:MAG: 4-hydroxy-tetrahydrodipicolinate reductase [Flavobacterium sp.]|nr:4-hydroxy-tetrahydrodipicolinate reductase [Pedobacter sp.]